MYARIDGTMSDRDHVQFELQNMTDGFVLVCEDSRRGAGRLFVSSIDGYLIPVDRDDPVVVITSDPDPSIIPERAENENTFGMLSSLVQEAPSIKGKPIRHIAR